MRVLIWPLQIVIKVVKKVNPPECSSTALRVVVAEEQPGSSLHLSQGFWISNVSMNSSGPIPKMTQLLPVTGLGSPKQAGCHQRPQQPSHHLTASDEKRNLFQG